MLHNNANFNREVSKIMLGCIMGMEHGMTIPVFMVSTAMYVKLTQFAVNNTNLD